MNEPTEEQIKELWEWCGFGIDGVGIWHCPDGITELGGMPKVTLDNLFKWAVPRFCSCELSIEEGIFAVARVGDPHLGIASHLIEIKDGRPDIAFALALFWAIYKVIKEQK